MAEEQIVRTGDRLYRARYNVCDPNGSLQLWNRSMNQRFGVHRTAILFGVIVAAGIPKAVAQVVDRQAVRVNVPAQAARPLDSEFGFRILVWQYRTDALADAALYSRLNLKGWHIDRGQGQQKKAEWARQQNWPYYVDHAAGKGILHLTNRSGLETIARDGSPSARPWSFFDPKTYAELKNRLRSNLPDVSGGPVMAIALDDEVSLGAFNSPLEVDYSNESLDTFAKWISNQYLDGASLRKAWELSEGKAPRPQTYEGVRRQISERDPSGWRLAPWMDFRSFMDQSQAAMFGRLVGDANQLVPGVPVGVVGGQQPSAYGGFDYSRLRDSVQWMEAYDIGATNELLRSFWSQSPRRPHMQTYFLSGDLSQDKWFLWYYLLHGCRSVIAWPDVGGKAWFENGAVHESVGGLAETFKQVQDDRYAFFSHPETTAKFSPIAILYSHPSVQVGWAIDASTHGKTWPRRSSSLDNRCLTSGKNRVAWTRLLEDLGYQAQFFDTRELVAGRLEDAKVKVLILPQTFALDERECEAIKRFAQGGGVVVADYGTAIVDTHGTGYPVSPLDGLFGIDRSEDRGWFDAERRYGIDGEKYSRPLIERLPGKGTLKDRGMVVAERVLESTLRQNRVGAGRTLFINSSPTAYFDPVQRAGEFGETWRSLIRRVLQAVDVAPLVTFRRSDGIGFGIEPLVYRTHDGREVWAFVANPTRQARIDGAAGGLRVRNEQVELSIDLNSSVGGLRDLASGRMVSSPVRFALDEALVLEALDLEVVPAGELGE